MKSTLIDAGPIIALFDGSDQYHQQVLRFMEGFEGSLISSWPVVTEVCYMLDFNKNTQLNFLDWIIEGGIEIFNIEQSYIIGIRNRMDKYSNLPADLADASLLEIAEARNLDSIITLDNDFDVYRINGKRSLTNVLS